MISLCIPTRNRPKIFSNLCNSVLEHAFNTDNIEFISYHDSDDKSIYEYAGNHSEVIGERIVLSDMYNKCHEVGTGPIYMWLSDDIIFETKDWDKYVQDFFDKSPDKIWFLHPNDHHYRSLFGVVGFLHENWIKTVGYFMPPYFSAWYADNWINDVSKRIQRKRMLREMTISHIPVEDDDTHKDHMIRLRKDDNRKIYESLVQKREEDAKLLLNFINHEKNTG